MQHYFKILREETKKKNVYPKSSLTSKNGGSHSLSKLGTTCFHCICITDGDITVPLQNP
jgi:hypothetical protein